MLAAATNAYPWITLTQPVNALAFVCDGILFGGGDFAYCAAAMVSAVLPALALFASGSGASLHSVWGGLSLLMTIRAVAAIARLLSGTGPWGSLRDPSPGHPSVYE